MARVRWERMNHYRNQSTYKAIECEHAQAKLAAQQKNIAPVDEAVEREDPRTLEEMVRAANAALRGEAA